MKEENGEPQTETNGPPAAAAERSEKKGSAKTTHQKDWLAVGGIGIEKRRRSSASSYRIENNKVMIENEDGTIQELEIVSSKEKHGNFRKAVPALPVPFAMLCLLLSIVPGLGTLVSGLAVLCGFPTEHSTKSAGVCWNLLAAFLQVLLSPIIVGLIWSVQRGVILLQESLTKKINEREEKAKKESA